jgi:hypothetical protein
MHTLLAVIRKNSSDCSPHVRLVLQEVRPTGDVESAVSSHRGRLIGTPGRGNYPRDNRNESDQCGHPCHGGDSIPTHGLPTPLRSRKEEIVKIFFP